MLKKIILLLSVIVLATSCNKNNETSKNVIKKEDKNKKVVLKKKQPKDIERLQNYFKLGEKTQKQKSLIFKDANILANKLRKSIKPFFIKKTMPLSSEMNIRLTGDIVVNLMKDNNKIYQISLRYLSEVTEKIKKGYNSKYLTYPMKKYGTNFTKLIVGNFELIIIRLEKEKEKEIVIDTILKEIDYKSIEKFTMDKTKTDDLNMIKELKKKGEKLVSITSEITKDKNTAIVALKPFLKKLQEKYSTYKFKISYSGNYTILMKKEKKQHAWIMINHKNSFNKKLQDSYTDKFLDFKAKRITNLSLKVLVNNLNISIIAKKDGDLTKDSDLDDIFKNLDLKRLKKIQ